MPLVQAAMGISIDEFAEYLPTYCTVTAGHYSTDGGSSGNSSLSFKAPEDGYLKVVGGGGHINNANVSVGSEVHFLKGDTLSFYVSVAFDGYNTVSSTMSWEWHF